MKKKIVFVTEALWIGGIETALINLLNHIDYDRFDVTLLVSKAYLDMADQVNPNCRLVVADRDTTHSFNKPYRFALLYHLTEKTGNPSKLHRALMWLTPAIRWIENRLYIGYVRNNMRSERYDTAVIYSDRTAELTVRAIRAGKYLMYYHHGAMRKEYHDEIGYRRSEKIIAVSKGIADKLADYRPRYSDKITVINNLIDIQNVIEKSREKAIVNFSDNDYNIVTCGRISKEKGIDIALDVCVQMIHDGIGNIHWWIIGGGPMENEIRSRTEMLGITNRFHMLGMQANPYPYIARADLYVQPSRFEGHCVTVLEARVLGKPIVATDAAASEQLTDGVDGTLCAPEAQSLYQAIKKHLQHPELSERYRTALAKHSFEEDNANIIAAIEALL